MASQSINRPTALAGTFGELIAEFFGTLVLLLFGDGCVASMIFFGQFVSLNWMVIAWGWGLAVMLGIYIAGAVSGAHINPAVTLAFAVRGKLPWSKVIPYWVAQVLGAFIAAAILFFVYQGALVNYETINHIVRNVAGPPANPIGAGVVFYTYAKPFVGVFGAFCDEFVGTALLVGLIFAIVDLRNQPVQANLNPMIIGLLIVAIGLSFGLNTGYAINPARDFGPRLFALIAGWGPVAIPGPGFYFWIPIIGPLAGGVVGALIYDFTVHKVLIARGLLPSGTSEVRGEAVREEPAD
ncbi:MIP family channel protein [Ktedonosporobacter rubrisoli]|uniref:MIP family channel protein n=1 Tax=Ktedonosporobacter rubrisoli TaxID=2509675 RepID=A0A4P6JRC4_KTERU|nr:MIP family channel protein [Ktedonosporobacter rubrisoli]QBD77750.1 MIP family channel protein [Ktedonosporobacter rubrisoli]